MTSIGRTVLLAEDDDGMREALERVLQFAGFECIAFESAEALLASGECARAACVVSDLMLPGMSGLDLIAAVRSSAMPPPCVLITAHDRPGLHQEAVRKGAAAYIAKPFRGSALLEIVQPLVDAATHDGST